VLGALAWWWAILLGIAGGIAGGSAVIAGAVIAAIAGKRALVARNRTE
jgi:hypothetical protein